MQSSSKKKKVKKFLNKGSYFSNCMSALSLQIYMYIQSNLAFLLHLQKVF